MPYRGDSYGEAPSRLTIFGIGGAILAFVLLVLFLIFKPFVIIDPGQRGVVTRLGQIQNEVMGEGFHWYNSLSSSVHEIDVRTQKADFEGTAGSQDLQIVKFKVAVNYHLNPELVHRTYQQVGDEDAVKERITQPAVQEAVKAATARFTAEQLLTQRDKLKDQIDLALAERLRINNVILDGVSITDIDFSNEFNNAIEKKVTAEQRAKEEVNKLEQVKAQAQQQIETAKAQAETIRIQAEAVNKQGGADYVKLKAIEKWDGRLPQYQLGQGAVTPFVDLGSLK